MRPPVCDAWTRGKPRTHKVRKPFGWLHKGLTTPGDFWMTEMILFRPACTGSSMSRRAQDLRFQGIADGFVRIAHAVLTRNVENLWRVCDQCHKFCTENCAASLIARCPLAGRRPNICLHVLACWRVFRRVRVLVLRGCGAFRIDPEGASGSGGNGKPNQGAGRKAGFVKRGSRQANMVLWGHFPR